MKMSKIAEIIEVSVSTIHLRGKEKLKIYNLWTAIVGQRTQNGREKTIHSLCETR